MARKNKLPPYNPTPDAPLVGQHPDGSPWCMGVGFGANVWVDPYRAIKVGRNVIDVDDAEQQALAMLAAVEWIRNDRSGQIEAEAAKAATQGVVRRAARIVMGETQ